MKKMLSKKPSSSFLKKVTIVAFAFATLFMFNTTTAYASETDVNVQEQNHMSGRTRTEREERILLPNGVRSSIDMGLNRTEGRTRTERESRILLPNGFRDNIADLELNRPELGLRNEDWCVREQIDELGLERSDARSRTERESRSVRNRLTA